MQPGEDCKTSAKVYYLTVAASYDHSLGGIRAVGGSVFVARLRLIPLICLALKKQSNMQLRCVNCPGLLQFHAVVC